MTSVRDHRLRLCLHRPCRLPQLWRGQNRHSPRYRAEAARVDFSTRRSQRWRRPKPRASRPGEVGGNRGGCVKAEKHFWMRARETSCERIPPSRCPTCRQISTQPAAHNPDPEPSARGSRSAAVGRGLRLFCTIVGNTLLRMATSRLGRGGVGDLASRSLRWALLERTPRRRLARHGAAVFALTSDSTTPRNPCQVSWQNQQGRINGARIKQAKATTLG
jgi:hypothetical protein